jgi:hypothetical protein
MSLCMYARETYFKDQFRLIEKVSRTSNRVVGSIILRPTKGGHEEVLRGAYMNSGVDGNVLLARAI